MLNCAIIMGRLTADPELRTTSNGTSVTSFTVAVDRNFTRPGEDRQADFINVVAWRQSADFVTRYFHKGSMIAVQGSIQTRSYEDKNGNRRTAVEIIADRVSFCGSKTESNTGTTRYENAPAPAFTSGNDAAGSFSVLPDDDEDDDALGYVPANDGEEIPF
jgi:single-strand DNA-binding protein